MRYAEEYLKSNCPDKESIGKEIAYEYLTDVIPSGLEDAINYEVLVDMLDVEILDVDDRYIVLSDVEFDELYENITYKK